MHAAERDAMLRLSMAPHLGPRRVKALLAAFGSAAAALAATADALHAVDGVGASCIRSLVQARHMDTRGVWRQAERAAARAVLLSDPEYPALLRQIDDPPPLLWVKGPLPGGDARFVAVVGTRRATGYGREQARHVAGELAAAGIVVVSGLALGIDGEAHRAALAAGGATLGVLGCGIDRIYPSAHRSLAGGMTVLSELMPGTPSAPGQFPRRNRIIAGMSAATVVVEARSKGGALITARLAVDMGREVFAVPGPVTSEASRGTHGLVRDGEAHIMVHVGDMLRELWPDCAPPAPVHEPVTAVEKRLMAAIEPLATPLDDVCRRSGVEFSTALATLLGLEIRGFVRQLAGRQFLRTRLAEVALAGAARD